MTDKIIKINDILLSPEYKFLKNSDYFDRIMFLTLGGSISYGTNIKGSDIDIRGCVLNSKEELLTFTPGEQYEDESTDTVLYTFNKLFNLLLDCNPNCLEMLFTKKEHRIDSELGKILVENREKFLSQKAVYAYNGYINAQTHRIKNAMRKDGELSLEDELIYERARLEDLIVHFNTTRTYFDKSSMNFRVDNDKILMDFSLVGYPVSDLSSILSEITNVNKSWKKVAKLTERELDAKKLAKFAMHILRLLKQLEDILSTGTFSTFVEDEKRLEEMMKTRNGYFTLEDGTLHDSFFDLTNEYQQRVEYAKKHSVLKETYDEKEMKDLFMYINSKILTKGYEPISF